VLSPTPADFLYNGLSKGVAYHIQHGKDMLTDSKWDLAIVSGRVAATTES